MALLGGREAGRESGEGSEAEEDMRGGGLRHQEGEGEGREENDGFFGETGRPVCP